MLDAFISANIFAFLLVFARLGAALMLLPPFGDVFVFPRARLALALALSAVVMPIALPGLPAAPQDPITLALLLGGEIAVGLLIGTLVRILTSALHTASIIVAYQTGFGIAAAFNPSQREQGILISRFLTLLGLVLLFTTDLHRLLLAGLVESYRAVPAGMPPPVGDFAAQAVDFVAGAFATALKISAPLLILGFLFYLALGLLSRLMPSIQVLFVALPLQIGLGFWALAVMLAGVMLWYLDDFGLHAGRMFQGG